MGVETVQAACMSKKTEQKACHRPFALTIKSQQAVCLTGWSRLHKSPATGAGKASCFSQPLMPLRLVGGARIEMAVVLNPDAVQQFKLRFQKVDMPFFVLQKLFKQSH